MRYDIDKLRGPYSQRQRYSNATLTGSTLTPLQPNVERPKIYETAYHVDVVSNSPTYGSVSVAVVSLGSGAPVDYAASNASANTLSFAADTPKYPAGTVLKLTATVKPGGKFVGWSTGATALTIVHTVTAPVRIWARFDSASAVQTHGIALSCVKAWGTITGDGVEQAATNARDTKATWWRGGATVRHGDTITIKATPKAGYEFVQWTRVFDNNQLNGLSLTEPTLAFKVTAAAELTAVFRKTTSIPKPEDPGETPGGGEDHKETPGNNGGGNGGNGGGNGGNGSLPKQPEATASTLDKVKAFLREWWWAVAIGGYILYNETRKGGAK